MLPAMVLCAGFGTRLRPITEVVPKPLLPVGDRPAIAHTLDRLRDAGFGPVAMNTHHRAESFDGALPADVRISHEVEILGTAGGVRHAAGAMGEGDVLVWNGDVLAEPDLHRLVRVHGESAKGIATLLAVRRSRGEGTLGLDPTGGVVRLRGELFGNEVMGADFLGIQVLREATREVLPQQGCLVGDVYLPALRRGERVEVCLHEGEWDDIGTPHALLRANVRWLRRMGIDCWVSGDAVIGGGVELADSVVCPGASVAGRGAVARCLVLAGATATAPLADAVVMADGRIIAAG